MSVSPLKKLFCPSGLQEVGITVLSFLPLEDLPSIARVDKEFRSCLEAAKSSHIFSHISHYSTRECAKIFIAQKKLHIGFLPFLQLAFEELFSHEELKYLLDMQKDPLAKAVFLIPTGFRGKDVDLIPLIRWAVEVIAADQILPFRDHLEPTRINPVQNNDELLIREMSKAIMNVVCRFVAVTVKPQKEVSSQIIDRLKGKINNLLALLLPKLKDIYTFEEIQYIIESVKNPVFASIWQKFITKAADFECLEKEYGSNPIRQLAANNKKLINFLKDFRDEKTHYQIEADFSFRFIDPKDPLVRRDRMRINKIVRSHLSIARIGYERCSHAFFSNFNAPGKSVIACTGVISGAYYASLMSPTTTFVALSIISITLIKAEAFIRTGVALHRAYRWLTHP